MTVRLALVILVALGTMLVAAAPALNPMRDEPAVDVAPSSPDREARSVAGGAAIGARAPALVVDGAPDSKPEPAADEEQDDGDGWVGPPDPIPDCEAKLEAAGVEFSPARLPLHQTRSGITCGAEQVVRYHRGPGAISWGGRPTVTCGVALAMARLELIVQEQAEQEFGRPVRRIRHMGTYNCREMANYPGWVSEHSYANAIDIKHFELRGGAKIPVLGEYPKNGAEPKSARGRFLGRVARRLYDERVFSVVLTPSFDRAHRNHFHLDQARYQVDGT